MKMGMRISRQELNDFLEYYRNTGQKMKSCERAGFSYASLKNYMNKDPEFMQQVQEAHQYFIEQVEGELKRRALEGVDRTVYFKGQQIGVVREYSDRLLEVLVKKLEPRYIEKVAATEHAIALAAGGDQEEGKAPLSLDQLNDKQKELLKELIKAGEQDTTE